MWKSPGLSLLFLAFLCAGFYFLFWEKHNPFYGKWEGEITYYNASSYDKTLRYSFRRWQESGIPLKFVRVENKEDADLLVYSNTHELRKRCQDCLGYATIGDNILRQARIDLLPPINPFEERVIDFARVNIIIHEIGHVLGLRHEKEGCSVMNVASLCYQEKGMYLSSLVQARFCGPWEDDLIRLEKIYDFKRKKTDSICYQRGKRSLFYLNRARDMTGYLNKGKSYIKAVFFHSKKIREN